MYDYEKMKVEMFEGDNASKHYKLYTIVVSICVRKGTWLYKRNMRLRKYDTI